VADLEIGVPLSVYGLPLIASESLIDLSAGEFIGFGRSIS